jgi:hypothetical protein
MQAIVYSVGTAVCVEHKPSVRVQAPEILLVINGTVQNNQCGSFTSCICGLIRSVAIEVQNKIQLRFGNVRVAHSVAQAEGPKG